MYLFEEQKPSTAAHWITETTICFKSGTFRPTTLSLSFKSALMWWGIAPFLGFSEEPKLITAKLLHLKEVQTALEHAAALSSGVHMGKTQTSSANSLDCANIKTVWRSDTAIMMSAVKLELHGPCIISSSLISKIEKLIAACCKHENYASVGLANST